MKKSIIGFTFSIIASVTYLVAVILMVTVIDTNVGGGVYMGEAVVAVSAASAVLSLIGFTYGMKGRKEQSSLGTVAIIISIIVLIVAVATSIIMALMTWG